MNIALRRSSSSSGSRPCGGSAGRIAGSHVIPALTEPPSAASCAVSSSIASAIWSQCPSIRATSTQHRETFCISTSRSSAASPVAPSTPPGTSATGCVVTATSTSTSPSMTTAASPSPTSTPTSRQSRPSPSARPLSPGMHGLASASNPCSSTTALAIVYASSPTPAAARASNTAAPGPTRHAQSERRNASSRQLCANGLMLVRIRTQISETTCSRNGSTNITGIDPTPASATKPPSADPASIGITF
jgi:hypothetical protein